MHDAGRVGNGQRISQLRRQVDRPVGVEGGCRQQLPQRLAAHELHRDERDVAVLANAVNGDDIGVREAGRGAGLFFEASQPRGIETSRALQHLQGDVAAEPEVSGAVHGAHASRAEKRHHLVATDVASRGEGLAIELERFRRFVERRLLEVAVSGGGVPQQRLDFRAELGIARAGSVQKFCTGHRRDVTRGVIDALHRLPALRGQVTRHR